MSECIRDKLVDAMNKAEFVSLTFKTPDSDETIIIPCCLVSFVGKATFGFKPTIIHLGTAPIANVVEVNPI